MKVDDIIIGKQVSKHLYHFEQDIEPEDLLKIIKFLVRKGGEPGYLYEKKKIFYTKSELITRQEFEYVYEHTDKNLDYLLDIFTRDELANKVGSAIKIISSTTKTEIVQRIIRDKNLLFGFFKEYFVGKYCSKWHEFKRQKIFLPAASDKTKNLAFTLNRNCDSLSGKHYLQYWRLGDKYNTFELNRDFKTEIIGNDLAINLKDSDEVITKSMHKFLRLNDKVTEFDLSCVYEAIDNRDLDMVKAGIINYSLGINALSEYFGLRMGSKFKTFSEGLRQRKDLETVEKYLCRKFIIASDNHDIYSGIAHNEEFFEKIAWHLKLEYLKDKRILCKVTEDETQETITAIWEMMSEHKYTGEFSLVEI